MCKQYHKLIPNPQAPEQEELVDGRATPEEKYVLSEHDFKGISCDGSGLIPEILEDHDPEVKKVANPV